MSHGPARFEKGGRTARGEVDVLLVLSLGDGRLLTLQVTTGASVRVVCELTGRSEKRTDLGQAATDGAGLLVAEVKRHVCLGNNKSVGEHSTVGRGSVRWDVHFLFL